MHDFSSHLREPGRILVVEEMRRKGFQSLSWGAQTSSLRVSLSWIKNSAKLLCVVRSLGSALTAARSSGSASRLLPRYMAASPIWCAGGEIGWREEQRRWRGWRGWRGWLTYMHQRATEVQMISISGQCLAIIFLSDENDMLVPLHWMCALSQGPWVIATHDQVPQMRQQVGMGSVEVQSRFQACNCTLGPQQFGVVRNVRIRRPPLHDYVFMARRRFGFA